MSKYRGYRRDTTHASVVRAVGGALCVMLEGHTKLFGRHIEPGGGFVTPLIFYQPDRYRSPLLVSSLLQSAKFQWQLAGVGTIVRCLVRESERDFAIQSSLIAVLHGQWKRRKRQPEIKRLSVRSTRINKWHKETGEGERREGKLHS